MKISGEKHFRVFFGNCFHVNDYEKINRLEIAVNNRLAADFCADVQISIKKFR